MPRPLHGSCVTPDGAYASRKRCPTACAESRTRRSDERADDVVRGHCAVLGQAAAARVDPDARHAELLRRRDVPLEVVADHPRVRRASTPSALKRPSIHALVRLSESQLPFDENRVEQIRELEARQSSCRWATPAPLVSSARRRPESRSHRTVSMASGSGAMPMSRRWLYASPMHAASVVVLDAEIEQREPHDLAARSLELKASFAMAIRIVPEPFRRLP